MLERLVIARLFLIGGAILAVVGLALFFFLPIQSGFPPFLVTALLALTYGVACRWRDRSGGGKKP